VECLGCRGDVEVGGTFPLNAEAGDANENADSDWGIVKLFMVLKRGWKNLAFCGGFFAATSFCCFRCWFH